MDSTRTRILPTEEELAYPTSRSFRRSGRRTSSFSSSSTSKSWDSSFGSFNDEYPPPFSPLISTPPNFNGVPFSWEKIPGIPKHQLATKMDESSGNLLPLPPAGNSNSSTKKFHNQEQKHQYSSNVNRLKRDPFFAALVECSKDGDHDHDDTNLVHTGKGSSSKISRTLTDGFRCIDMCTSCKRTCSITESIVCLPKSKPHYRRLNRRSS